MAKPTAEVLIDLNISSALGGLNEFSDRLDATMKSAQQSIRGLTAAWEAAVAITKFVVTNLAAWGAKAAEVDRIERSLATAARLRGDATGAATRALLAHNAAMERKLGIDAEDLAVLQKRLLTMGVSVDRLQEATKATIGLVESTGSLESAAALIGRAYDGNFKALQKWVGASKTADEAISKAIKNYAIAEANADSYSTQIKIMEKGLEGLEEEAGKAVISNEELGESLRTFNSIVHAVTPVVSTLVDVYLKLETIPIRIANFYRENNIFKWLLVQSEEAEEALRNVAAAQQILGAGAPITDQPGKNLSDHPLVTGNRKGGISIPNPVGSRTNPEKAKAEKSTDSLISEQAKAILEGAADLNDIETEILEQRLARDKNYQKVSADLEKRAAEFKENLRKESRDRILENDLRADRIEEKRQEEAFKKRNEFYEREKAQLATFADFSKFATETLAGSMNNAIAGLTESLASGSGDVRQILFEMLSNILLQMGAFFAAQASTNWSLVVPTQGGTLGAAIGYTAAAAASFAGAGALRGAASGGSAPSGGGGGGSRGGSSSSSFYGSGSGGGGSFGSASPRSRSSSGSSPVVYQISFAGAIVGGDARRISEDLERILRDGERNRPRRFR